MEIIFSFVQHTMLKTLKQVYPTSVQELVYWYHCDTQCYSCVRRCCMQASHRRSCSATYKHRTAILKHLVLHICQVDLYESFWHRTLNKTKDKFHIKLLITGYRVKENIWSYE